MDTNIFIAAVLNSAGSNREVLRACLQGRVRPLMGAALFHEFEGVLERADLMKMSPLSPKDRQSLFEAFLSVCEWVRVYFLWRPNLPDEGDNHLVELALAGGAECIVTNNIKDVRRGELTFPNLRVLTPAQFLPTLRSHP